MQQHFNICARFVKTNIINKYNLIQEAMAQRSMRRHPSSVKIPLGRFESALRLPLPGGTGAGLVKLDRAVVVGQVR